MKKKTILGLDLGTNSIGWALVESDFENKEGKILGLGTRIIPMSQDIIGQFESGNSVSQTADRTNYRSIRRLRERHLLRRERLHRVLNTIGFLPQHYAEQIDFENRLGQFRPETEPKIAYIPEANNTQQQCHYRFLFMDSFREMVADFKVRQPHLLKNEQGEDKLIPYDWTIYYLRKKALTQKIERSELAWIILNFNQKRGYYQLRGEDEVETPNKLIEFHALTITSVVADEQPNSKGDLWYSLGLENGWTYRRSSKTPLFDWQGKTKDFIVTTELNDDGSVKLDKEGNERRSFRAPQDDDWTLIKKKTELVINNSKKTVGTYIYDTLLQNPNQKINGKLVRTIERKFYKEELKKILETQKRFHEELQNRDLYNYCVKELYKNNISQQLILGTKDFTHLFINDIIFFQRPLKSKKSSIGNCTFEYHKYRDKGGNEHTTYLKAIPKSHPLYQELRLWQWIRNLSVYKNEDNVTKEFLYTSEDYEKLFEFLNNRPEIKQDILLKYLLQNRDGGLKGKALTEVIKQYRWNFVEDKIYPGNKTHYEITKRLSGIKNLPSGFLTSEIEYNLWHIIYSVTDKFEFEKALQSFAKKHELDQHLFLESFQKFPSFDSEYGAYSEKAIKKLLPLMRQGKYWHWDMIDNTTKLRIEKIITGEYDENIKEQVRKKTIYLTEKCHFQGLPLWLATYVVYGRHSEARVSEKWNSVEDIHAYLKEFKQHSLHNPIAEQVITEALRVTADIWKYHGGGSKNFFDEVHIELGRDMKSPLEVRKQMTKKLAENENTNIRIKALLAEMLNDHKVENVRPYSPMQHEALKIYENGVLNSGIEIPDEIRKISTTAQPSTTQLIRYKLWLEQKYRSPYTGKIIPLNKLFTADYEIEHIIPQSRFFDDSLSNKVICESAVNKIKDNQLAMEFINNHHGEVIETGLQEKVTVCEKDVYEEFIKRYYANNRSKRNKLLLEEIPDKMVERQLNDTRYISKFISSLLSNIVRAENNDDGVNSKNVIAVNGKITSVLKREWGLNDVWNDLILSRFERMNETTNSTLFTTYNNKYQKYLPTVPIEYSKNFQKKRIDHRHHAMDALVIACTTGDHVNLLNNQYARSKERRFDLQRKLRKFEKKSYLNIKDKHQIERMVPGNFIKPWKNFTADAKIAIEEMVISFKQNLRIINKTTNHFQKWIETDGIKEKKYLPQIKGDSWAIRKPMHKETIYGKVNLPRVKVPKGKLLTATRKAIDSSFNLKTIESITDTGIQKILINYLASKDNNPELAFTAEGLENMNQNIRQYNDGKYHQPIYKVRVFESGSRFALGQEGNKKAKYVEAAKGTNLFFTIYQDSRGNRTFDTIPLNDVIEHQKWRATLPADAQKDTPMIPTNPAKGSLLFSLSPNDLVYVPTEEEENESGNTIHLSDLNKEQIKRIYKAVSFTGNRAFFIQHSIAGFIVNKMEFSAMNKMERAIDGKMIKESCIKIVTDRIGNIVKIYS